MRRLRDEVDASDHRLVAAGRLMAQIEPLETSDVRMRRVRRSIDRHAGTGARRPVGIVLAVLLGFTGSAAAAFGVSEWMSDEEPVSPRPATELAPSPTSSERRIEPPRDPGDAPEARDPELPVLDPSDAGSRASPAPAPASAQVAARRKAASRSEAETAPAPTLSEARLVQEAVEALRNGNDPDRARELLSEYQAKSSSGRLDEEVLALAIEVSLTKKSPDAARHAQTYLRKYPGGRFTALARRALRTQ